MRRRDAAAAPAQTLAAAKMRLFAHSRPRSCCRRDAGRARALNSAISSCRAGDRMADEQPSGRTDQRASERAGRRQSACAIYSPRATRDRERRADCSKQTLIASFTRRFSSSSPPLPPPPLCGWSTRRPSGRSERSVADGHFLILFDRLCCGRRVEHLLARFETQSRRQQTLERNLCHDSSRSRFLMHVFFFRVGGLVASRQAEAKIAHSLATKIDGRHATFSGRFHDFRLYRSSADARKRPIQFAPMHLAHLLLVFDREYGGGSSPRCAQFVACRF